LQSVRLCLGNRNVPRKQQNQKRNNAHHHGFKCSKFYAGLGCD
jgi:hypothetical protein